LAGSPSISPSTGAGNDPAGSSTADVKQDDEEMGNADADVGVDVGEEMQRPKKPSAVTPPSKAEIEDHMLTGCSVFRTWCPHCVASQGRGNPHVSNSEVSEVPVLGFDYGFMSKEKGAMPMIVGRDSESGSHAATFLECKGRNNYAVSYLVS
jgi:hypothetical protein